MSGCGCGCGAGGGGAAAAAGAGGGAVADVDVVICIHQFPTTTSKTIFVMSSIFILLYLKPHRYFLCMSSAMLLLM